MFQFASDVVVMVIGKEQEENPIDARLVEEKGIKERREIS